jgi:L-ascorbate metabolism protein UlaG (beta-lactamase superfamily)
MNSLKEFFIKREKSSEYVNLIWLGQAGFALKYKEKIIIIDPYLSDFLAKKYKGKIFPHVRLMDIPITPEKVNNVNFVCCTHAHSDHMDPETVSVLSTNNPNCKFIIPAAEISEATKRGIKKDQIFPINADQTIFLDKDISIKAIPASHENVKINKNGEHHFLGYILRVGDISIYHSGDCVPYEGLSEKIKNNNVDVALLPINGRDDFRLKNGIAGNFKIPEVLDLCLQAEINYLIVHHFGMFAYNTVSKQDLEELNKKSTNHLHIILPEINYLYTIVKNT